VNDHQRALIVQLLSSDSLDGAFRCRHSAGSARLWLLQDPAWFAMERHRGAGTTRYEAHWTTVSVILTETRSRRAWHVSDFVWNPAGDRLLDFSIHGKRASESLLALSSSQAFSGILNLTFEPWELTFWPEGGLPQKMPWTRRTKTIDDLWFSVERRGHSVAEGEASGTVYLKRAEALGGTVLWTPTEPIAASDIAGVNVSANDMGRVQFDVCGSLDDEPLLSAGRIAKAADPAGLEPRFAQHLEALNPVWWRSLSEAERAIHLNEVNERFKLFRPSLDVDVAALSACSDFLVESGLLGG
jgi:hypothetical protein